MDDLIRRQAAIDALEEPCKVTNTWTDEFAVGERMQWEKDVKALNNLPSAQRAGRWDAREGYYNCSSCGMGSLWATNYCPNCGAKMQNSSDGGMIEKRIGE